MFNIKIRRVWRICDDYFEYSFRNNFKCVSSKRRFLFTFFYFIFSQQSVTENILPQYIYKKKYDYIYIKPSPNKLRDVVSNNELKT